MIEQLNLDAEKMERALRNCYLMACRKRSFKYDYSDPQNPVPTMRKSEDEDWEHIKRFCEEAGIQSSPLRGVDV